MKIMRAPKAGAPVVHVIGSGEAFSPDFGNTSYLFRGKGYPSILFDCGYQIPERLWKAGFHTELDAIFVTHLHADHAFGIVPLLCRYWEEKRKTPLRIISGRGSERHIRKTMELGYPGILSKLPFPFEFTEISERDEIEMDSLRIRAARSQHSVMNHAYRVDFTNPKLRSFAVSGDGQMTPKTQALVSDVGILLQEIFSVDWDIPVHADLKSFAAWASGTSIGRIGVAHHSRYAISAVDKKVQALRRKDQRWFSLEPGMVLPL